MPAQLSLDKPRGGTLVVVQALAAPMQAGAHIGPGAVRARVQQRLLYFAVPLPHR